MDSASYFREKLVAAVRDKVIKDRVLGTKESSFGGSFAQLRAYHENFEKGILDTGM